MAAKSDIQWTDSTWNPWHGCRKVSPGCKYCYMYRDKERYGQDPTTVIRSKSKFYDPMTWSEGRMVFTCSWSDFFIEEADEWRDEAWKIIKSTPQHTYQILTKRPERIADNLPSDWGTGYSNVILGVSVESHEQVHRIITLTHLKTTSSTFKTFVSAEPLIGFIDFRGDGVVESYAFETGIDWVIVGGESGNNKGKYKYRPCEISWIEHIIDDCRDAGVPIFIKQLGTHLSKVFDMKHTHGGDINEWPERFKIREFPIFDTNVQKSQG